MSTARAFDLGAATSGQLPLVLGLATLFLALLCVGLVVFPRRAKLGVPTMTIEQYRRTVTPPPQDTSGRSAPFRLLLETSERLLGPGRRQRSAAQLDLARVSLTPAEWLVVRIATAGFTAIAFTALSGSLIGGVVGLALGWFACRYFLRRRVARRRAAFSEQLPDTLQLLVGALQAGFSLPQALDAVVREDTQPIAGELGRALARTRLGASLEEALEVVAQRMASTDFAWLVMAIRIQRHVGGNLAELLLTTVHTMRERSALRRQVRALSAEGRMSAYVLIGLPVILALWMFISRRAYIEPLYTTPMGLMLFGSGIACVTIGWFWMSSMMKMKV